MRTAPIAGDAVLNRKDVVAVARIVLAEPWAAAALMALGLIAAAAESVGVSLVALIVYEALSGAPTAAAGALGVIADAARAMFGDGTGRILSVVTLVALRAAVSYSYRLIAANIRGRHSERIRDALHLQYLKVDFGFIRRHEQSDLLNLLAVSSWSLAEAFLMVSRIFINACTIVVFLCLIAAMSPAMFVAAALGSFLLFAALRRLHAPARALGVETTDVNRRLAERMLVTLQGMRVIRAFGQERAAQEAYRRASAAARRTTYKMERLFASIGPVTELGYLALLGLLVVVGDWSDAPAPTILAVVVLLYRLQPHVRELESNLLGLAQLEAPIARVMHMLDRTDKTYRPEGTQRFKTLGKEIKFRNVTLHYPGQTAPALDCASFRIPAGRRTALVGPSGSGKSTVVNLLLRLCEPSNGAILIDDAALSSLRSEDWLARVGSCGQDADLIEGTIIDNLKMAAPDADEAAIRSAVADAQFDDVVASLPDGVDSWLGQGATHLSGGQRQRLGIARALLRDPALLILDEATSALDDPLERKVMERLSSRCADRTVIQITHRPDMAMDADHMIVLDGGRVIWEGAPNDSARAER